MNGKPIELIILKVLKVHNTVKVFHISLEEFLKEWIRTILMQTNKMHELSQAGRSTTHQPNWGQSLKNDNFISKRMMFMQLEKVTGSSIPILCIQTKHANTMQIPRALTSAMVTIKEG